jgi:hypothetical protein
MSALVVSGMVVIRVHADSEHAARCIWAGLTDAAGMRVRIDLGACRDLTGIYSVHLEPVRQCVSVEVCGEHQETVADLMMRLVEAAG